MAETFDEGDKMRRWKKMMDDPSAVLNLIGLMMVGESKDAFKAQKFGKDKWGAPATPSVYGIIQDFHLGRTEPKKRRFDANRKALIDKGDLRNRIDHDLKGTRVVEVGSNLDYAGVLHHGGPIESLPIDPIRGLLYKWMRKQDKDLKTELGWMFARKFGKGLKGEVEPRPFVGVTKRTVTDIKELISSWIAEAGVGAAKVVVK